jgi:hypothetical protein
MLFAFEAFPAFTQEMSGAFIRSASPSSICPGRPPVLDRFPTNRLPLNARWPRRDRPSQRLLDLAMALGRWWVRFFPAAARGPEGVRRGIAGLRRLITAFLRLRRDRIASPVGRDASRRRLRGSIFFPGPWNGSGPASVKRAARMSV